jgi:hypothetical protein
MSSEPFYVPAKSYLDTLERDLFGLFAGMILNSESTKPIHTYSTPPAYAGDIQRARA